MIKEKPVRKIKRLLPNLPRDEVARAQSIIKRGGQLPKPVLEAELARFLRVLRYANYD